MRLLRCGLDGLDVAFPVHVGPELLQTLARGKEAASASRADAGVPIQTPGGQLMVMSSGSRGGYRFKAKSVGQAPSTWFFKMPALRDPWGVRVSADSQARLDQGFDGLRTVWHGQLARWGANPSAATDSISRIDIAFDFEIHDFRLDPRRFVTHGWTGQRERQEGGTPLDISRIGRRVTYVRCGAMPNRSVVVYDNRQEVLQKHKPYWWPAWNVWWTPDSQTADLPPPSGGSR